MRDFPFPRLIPRLSKAALTAVLALGVIAFSAPTAHADQPVPHGPDTAIVILGFGLQPDGTLRPELIDRLRAGYVEAFVSAASPVIVTGGNPQSGITEAQAMANWLTSHGLPPQRIHLEPAARSTVENAEYSAQLMTELGTPNAILITSGYHMPRALASFTAAGISVTSTYSPDELWNLLNFGPKP
ncbi:YdcF family protein [Nocardia sp. NBC_01388]|uniref:YdcF family protein n=1 Tax=Nocardia sp. NBC_01388 TaxID=2903596 RepID=UPI0032522558